VIPETNLAFIAKAELDKDEENYLFRQALQKDDGAKLDAQVQALNAEIAPRIDCTKCGNCCKSLMINVTEPEVETLSIQLNVATTEFKQKFIETSMRGDMIINKIPCHFLQGTTCSIYEHRFAECRDFPGLHRDGFANRLFATFMHYGRCPIIYNVIEQLKIKTGFAQKRTQE
jgi:Fe-S-cluster containining protein